MKIKNRRLLLIIALLLTSSGVAYATGCPVKATLMFAAAIIAALTSTGLLTGKPAWIMGGSLGVAAGAYVLYPYLSHYGDFCPKTWLLASAHQPIDASDDTASSGPSLGKTTPPAELDQKSVLWILQKTEAGILPSANWALVSYDTQTQEVSPKKALIRA
ncbi:MAG TPA: hypothetical protein PLV25_01960, partial [Opitutales bacterium]|nr:hypothetical protein [Opitutales bacterium]